MYKIPLNIIKLLNQEKVDSEKILYENNNFILIIDTKNTSKSFHYTGWYKHNIPSLEYANHIVLMHIKDLRKELIKEKIIDDSSNTFVHYPPRFYRLHVHFVQSNHIHTAPVEEVYDIDKIEKYLDNKFLAKL